MGCNPARPGANSSGRLGLHPIACTSTARSLTQMKKIKPNQILIGVTLLMLAATPAFSADQMTTSVHNSDHGEKYRAMETSLDVFGTGSIRQETINNLNGIRYRDDVEQGAGLGVNHFFHRNFGVGAEAYAEDTERHFIDKASASFIARFPLGESGFAPYAYVGGGRQFDPIELSFAQAGGGLEYRFTREVGIFTDGRYVLTDGAKDHGLVRVGLRLVF